MPTAAEITFLAALIAGLSASAHCFAMCGGIASALGMHARASAPGEGTSLDQVRATASPPLHRGGGLGRGHLGSALGIATLYQFGRVSGYTIAGAICGFIGAQAAALFDFMSVGKILRIASGVLIVLLALRLLVRWNALQWIELLGAKFWLRLRPLVQLAGSRAGVTKPLTLGLLWSLLPCGLIYSMLMFAAMSAEPLRGAGIMLAFGIGTLPSMLSTTLLAARIQSYMSRPIARYVSGALMLCFGIWMIVAAAAMTPGGHAHHH